MAPTRRSTPVDTALVAGFAALIAVCALLPAIPVAGPVPITLQTFAMILAGACLGARRGFLAALLYLAVGAAGLPVFSGGAAGIAVFVGPTAGYLLGFPFAAALTGFIVERLPRHRVATSIPLIMLAGLAGSFAFNHTFGMAGLVLSLDMTWAQAFRTDLVFWPGDVVKNLAVGVVATAVHRAFGDLLPRRRSRAERVTDTAAA